MRQATVEDIPRLLTYCERWFFEESGYADWVTFSRAKLSDWLESLIASEQAVVFAPEGGVGVVMLNGMYFTDDVTAHELLWRVEPEYRGDGLGRALKDAMEAWAKDQGAKIMSLSTLDAFPVIPEGYTPVERAYMRVL